ncbi:DUF6455 family protein [Nioella sp.]|uniref:DUF6455 family protein n=1 Tax=Nioella sp. TaxID=1912091 RepID=UPI003B528BBA
MGIFKTLSDSAGLVDDMADRLDVDLTHIGGLDVESSALAYRSMVLSCTACTQHEDCRHLLDDNAKLDDAPSYCRNRDVMHRA